MAVLNTAAYSSCFGGCPLVTTEHLENRIETSLSSLNQSIFGNCGN